MDGAKHLLIVIGDHAWHEAGGYTEKTLPVAGPDSHLGKLVRIELASGRAEILASGFAIHKDLFATQMGIYGKLSTGHRAAMSSIC